MTQISSAEDLLTILEMTRTMTDAQRRIVVPFLIDATARWFGVSRNEALDRLNLALWIG